VNRKLVGALLSISLLSVVACSGKGTTPTTVKQLSLPKSVSPASIHAAPMAKTAIRPASEMARRPQGAIEGANYTQIPGTASSVAAAADGSLWALSDQPSGPDKYIWHYASGTWTNITGEASQIAVAPNGTLYAINSGGGAYSYSGGTWTVLGGGSSAITTASDGSFYVLSNGNTTCLTCQPADQAIWHNVGGTWTQVPGAGVSIAGSFDTGTYVLTGGSVAPGGFYIANAEGTVYYENTDGSFVQLPAAASMLAPTTVGGVFGLQYPADANGSAIYYFNLDSPGWSQQAGNGVDISSNAGQLFVVAASAGIYVTPVTASATPTPTASPTVAPANAIANGDFATGSLAPWYICYAAHSANLAPINPNPAPTGALAQSSTAVGTPRPEVTPYPVPSGVPNLGNQNADATVQSTTPTGDVGGFTHFGLVGHSDYPYNLKSDVGICQDVTVPAAGVLSFSMYEGGNDAFANADTEADVYPLGSFTSAVSNGTTYFATSAAPTATLFAEENCYSNLGLETGEGSSTVVTWGSSTGSARAKVCGDQTVNPWPGGQWYQRSFSLAAEGGQQATIFLGLWHSAASGNPSATTYYIYTYFANVVLAASPT